LALAFRPESDVASERRTGSATAAVINETDADKLAPLCHVPDYPYDLLSTKRGIYRQKRGSYRQKRRIMERPNGEQPRAPLPTTRQFRFRCLSAAAIDHPGGLQGRKHSNPSDQRAVCEAQMRDPPYMHATISHAACARATLCDRW
jgi:hypothetical protein